MSTGHGGLVAAWYRGAPWLWLLRPLEFLFRAIAALRRSLYRVGILRVYRADRPVVVVGNITVGGTGKTPVVIALVESLQGAGLRPGVVSRGYGAKAGSFPHRVTEDSTAAECGDEPLLVYRRTGCPCVVSPDRPQAVRTLLADGSVDIVLSDDGLQHYALGRDLEIAVLDAELGVGNGFCLPAGPLREPPGRLKEVDALLYRGGSDPATAVSYQVGQLVNVVTGEQRPLSPDAFPDGVQAVAGIGRPEQFYATLRRAGLAIEECTFPDHHAFEAVDFARLDDRPVIMTEKDAVKCAALASHNAWYLQISANLPEAVVKQVIGLART